MTNKIECLLSSNFRNDLEYWVNKESRTAKRILKLMDNILKTPFEGIGKPEKIKYRFDIYSRRITQEHRLVYRVFEKKIVFLQCRFHYGNK